MDSNPKSKTGEQKSSREVKIKYDLKPEGVDENEIAKMDIGSNIEVIATEANSTGDMQFPKLNQNSPVKPKKGIKRPQGAAIGPLQKRGKIPMPSETNVSTGSSKNNIIETNKITQPEQEQQLPQQICKLWEQRKPQIVQQLLEKWKRQQHEEQQQFLNSTSSNTNPNKDVVTQIVEVLSSSSSESSSESNAETSSESSSEFNSESTSGSSSACILVSSSGSTSDSDDSWSTCTEDSLV